MLGRDGGRCGDPEVTKCSTERKTHRKSWKHEVIWVICGILLVWKQSSEGGYGQQQHSGSLWCLYKAPLVLSGPKCAKKSPPHHHTTSILNIWHKAGRIHVFMLFTPNSDPTVWNAQQKPSAALVLQGLTCCVHTLVIWVTVTFLKAVRLFSSDLWHQRAIFSQRTAAYWIFSLCGLCGTTRTSLSIFQSPLDHIFTTFSCLG